MASPTPPSGYRPIAPPAASARRLLPWQLAILAVFGSFAVVMLVFCGVVVAVQGPKSDRPAAASTIQAHTLSGGTASATAVVNTSSATVEPSPTQSPSTSPTPSPTMTPTPPPTENPPPPPPTALADPPTTTTTEPAADPTHAGPVTPGAFCKAAEHYWYGFSAKGLRYQCLDHNGWRWTAA
jgi:cell division septation protein DedD